MSSYSRRCFLYHENRILTPCCKCKEFIEWTPNQRSQIKGRFCLQSSSLSGWWYTVSGCFSVEKACLLATHCISLPGSNHGSPETLACWSCWVSLRQCLCACHRSECISLLPWSLFQTVPAACCLNYAELGIATEQRNMPVQQNLNNTASCGFSCEYQAFVTDPDKARLQQPLMTLRSPAPSQPQCVRKKFEKVVCFV